MRPDLWDQGVARRMLDPTIELDLQQEILALDGQTLGDTVLLFDDDLVAFGVCHSGARTEARARERVT